ncbi:hypothetical protein HR10_00790 [Porphyromonas gulae]|nr:hypothetical protein HR10_00790 [Porphyromonas gulae]
MPNRIPMIFAPIPAPIDTMALYLYPLTSKDLRPPKNRFGRCQKSILTGLMERAEKSNIRFSEN